MIYDWMINTFGEIITGLFLGIILSVVGYILVEIVKNYFIRRKQSINEFNYILTLLLEVNRAIKRAEMYLSLYVKKRRISLSRIYTFSYDTSLIELIKICSDSRIIDRFNYIYSIFSFVNFNIDKDRVLNGVSFISDHLLNIYKANNNILDILKSKRISLIYLIFFFKIPKVKISEYRFDKYSDIIEEYKNITQHIVPNKKIRIIDSLLIEEITNH